MIANALIVVALFFALRSVADNRRMNSMLRLGLILIIAYAISVMLTGGVS